jgi:hypothetical protein
MFCLPIHSVPIYFVYRFILSRYALSTDSFCPDMLCLPIHSVPICFVYQFILSRYVLSTDSFCPICFVYRFILSRDALSTDSFCPDMLCLPIHSVQICFVYRFILSRYALSTYIYCPDMFCRWHILKRYVLSLYHIYCMYSTSPNITANGNTQQTHVPSMKTQSTASPTPSPAYLTQLTPPSPLAHR